MNPDDDKFDESRAELFEALGHQTRIRLLQAWPRIRWVFPT